MSSRAAPVRKAVKDFLQLTYDFRQHSFSQNSWTGVATWIHPCPGLRVPTMLIVAPSPTTCSSLNYETGKLRLHLLIRNRRGTLQSGISISIEIGENAGLSTNEHASVIEPCLSSLRLLRIIRSGIQIY